METFKEYLTEHIKSSGITWKFAASKLGIPYVTFFKWTQGTEPPDYVQELIKKEIKTWNNSQV